MTLLNQLDRHLELGRRVLHGVGGQFGEHEGQGFGDLPAVLGHDLAEKASCLTDGVGPAGERPRGAQHPVFHCADIAGGGSGLGP